MVPATMTRRSESHCSRPQWGRGEGVVNEMPLTAAPSRSLLHLSGSGTDGPGYSDTDEFGLPQKGTLLETGHQDDGPTLVVEQEGGGVDEGPG
jgi:hypothetical protein